MGGCYRGGDGEEVKQWLMEVDWLARRCNAVRRKKKPLCTFTFRTWKPVPRGGLWVTEQSSEERGEGGFDDPNELEEGLIKDPLKRVRQ